MWARASCLKEIKCKKANLPFRKPTGNAFLLNPVVRELHPQVPGRNKRGGVFFRLFALRTCRIGNKNVYLLHARRIAR